MVGELVSFTATVAPVVPGSGTPTGSVTFAFGDGTAPVTATLSGGTATVTHTYSTVTGSPFGVTATYSGSAAFEPSAGSDTQTVSLVSTTTAVTSAPDPSVAGQQVTISATVAPVAPGTGTPTGTVTFDFGDGTAPVTAMLSGGTATVPHTYPTSTGSPYTVAVTYSGDTTFGPSTGTDTQTVSHAASTTTVVTSPGTALVGRPVTFNAAVSVNEPGAGTPTGTVTFDFGDGTSTTAQLADGIASVTHTYASAGGSPFTVTANYSGDGDFDPSTGTDIQVVNRGTTTTTVLTSPDPSVTGESVTVTATVEPGGAGFGGPTGTVTLDFGDGSAPATATLSDGVATVTHAYTDPGASPFTVVATYDGDDAFEGSSDTDAHSVNPALTATTVSSAPDPSTVGEDVTFTATVAVVAAGAGTPTGTVTFTFGDGTPSVTVPVEGSQATLTHSFTGASGSPFTVTAHYDGDTGFSASAGTDTQTVQPVGSSLTVTVSPDTPVTGQPVTVTATVTPDGPGAGTPTGTVTVDFGDGTPPVVVQLAGGQASATHAYADAAGGPYPITVTYSGDANVSPATATLTQTVTPSDTTTAVISSPEPSPTGVPVTVIATVAPVAPGTGMPTGTVTLDFGDGSSPEMVTLSGGVATTTHTYTEADGSPYTITAVYNGDAAFTTSTGTVTHAVDPEIITTTTTVASVPDPSDVGHVVMFTATVTPDDAGSGTPTGTVTFTFGDGTPQQTLTLSDGNASATHTYSDAAGSPYTVIAVYSGVGEFSSSTGTDTHSVNPAPTTLSVLSAPDPSETGESVTFTATVASDVTGPGTPGGTVVFDFGDGTASQTAELSDGQATVTHTYTDAADSPYLVTASYGGNAGFAPASGSDIHVVNTAAATISVVSSPDPSVSGQDVTILATVTPSVPGADAPTGTVTFTFGDGTPSATVPVDAGQAGVAHAYAGADGSPYTISAVYSGDSSFSPATAADTHTVQQAATVTTLSASPDPSVVGQPVTVVVTASVNPDAPGAGMPTGTVTFRFGDGSPPVIAQVSGGVATAEHTYTTTTGSPFAITATYDGDANFSSSTDSRIHEVHPAGTTTMVTSSPDPSRTGEPVVFTATVAPQAPGTGTPTGTVTFNFGDGSPPATVDLTGGTATAQHAYADVPGSPYSVVAVYNGEPNYSSSTGTDTQTVEEAATATTLTFGREPSTVGEPVTFTVSVAPEAPGGGTPAGSVTVDFGDGSPQQTVELVGGQATVTHPYTDASGSPYTVTATYVGSSGYATSTVSGTHTVDAAPTDTLLVTSPDPSQAAGSGAIFTAVVTAELPEAGTPTGTVTFTFGDGTPPVTEPLTGGVATTDHSYASIIGSPYPVSAAYGGTENFTGSSDSDTHRVELQVSTSTTTVTTAPASPIAGEPVTFTVTVTADAPGAPLPTGSVTFTFGDSTEPVTVPLSDGLATATHAYPTTAGNPYTVVAAYSGDTTLSSSTGFGTVTVQPVASTTAVSSGPEPSVVGQEVTFTATVAPQAPGVVQPTGTVTFDFGDGSAPATVSLVAGVAAVAHAFTSVADPLVVTASYSGDADTLASTGTDTQTVQQAASSMQVTTSPNPSVSGEPLTFTAVITPVPPGAGAPGGSVTFDFGDGTPPVVAEVSGGVATITHAYTGTAASPYTATAVYSGNAQFTAAAATVTHALQPALSATVLSSVPDPSVTGEPVTFTATVTTQAPGTGIPTGTVTFTFGDGTAPVTQPLSGGVATATHAYARASDTPYGVVAVYSGDADVTSSTAKDTQTVTPAGTSTTVTTSPDPSVPGQPVDVTVLVAPLAPGAGTPTGTVVLDFGDGSSLETVTLSGGVATVSHTWATTAGSPYTVSVTYSGDADFSTSTGADSHTVQPATSTVLVTSSPDPSVPGQPVDVTVLVAPLAPGAGTPTGTVVLDFGDGSSLETVTLSGGVATVSHTWATTAGSPYTVTVTYGGDADFSGATGTDTHALQRAATSTLVASSPDPSVTGQPMTVIATVVPLAPGDGVPTGSVTFTFGDGTPPQTVELTDGLASVAHTYSDAAGSPYPVMAAYDGDADFGSSTGNDTHTVQQAATTTTVASSPDPSVVGQQVTVTATVVPQDPGSGTPTGTVTFDFGDGTPTVTATPVDGVAGVSHTYQSAAGSPYTVTATYSGDTGFVYSTSTDTQSVQPASTTTLVTTSPEPSEPGQQVTLTAVVTPESPEAGVPTGTVTFTFGDVGAPVTATLSGGVATTTHTYASTAGSPFAVTASYNGSDSFTGSSDSDTHRVELEVTTTTTTVTSAPDPSVVGQPVTFTATVGPDTVGAPTPTGTVTFTYGDGSPSDIVPLTGGVATAAHPYTTTNGSPFAVTAFYNGDATSSTSTGTDTQTVGRASTTTQLVSSPDPSVVGQTVSFTATVASGAPGAGTPAGTVTFDFGDGSETVTKSTAGGVATAQHVYSATSGSPFTATATYNPDTDFSGSTGTDTHTVQPAATTTTVVSSPDASQSGQPMTVTATVAPEAPGAGTPTGTVTFSFGDGTPSATATLNGGVATVTHAYSGAGGSPYSITASYAGNSAFAASTGIDTHSVQQAATTTTAVTAPDPSLSGQLVTATATVAPEAPGAGTPTGTVTFSFGSGSAPVTATLSGGVAVAAYTYSSPGGSPYPVTAVYGGSVDFGSSAGTDTQTVNRASTTTQLTSAPDPSVTGQLVTFTATVRPTAPGSGTPSGTVTFTFGDGSAPVTAALNGGVATATRTYTAASTGPFTATATYGGSAEFLGSTATDTQTVNRASTSTTVVSSPDPSQSGQTATFTATVAPVSPGAGTPTGTVTFTISNGPTLTATLVGGKATVTSSTLSAGAHTVTATYSGSASFAASTGTDTHSVGRPSTTTTVVSAPDPSAAGQNTTFTVTVTPVPPATGTPTGTVTIFIIRGPNPTVTLVNGRATYTTSTLSPGAHAVVATYSGDTNYASSEGIDTHFVKTD
ncbi:Ig-like domain repeat protein [Streptomyces sp. NPDC048639]|uniref:Ig-like domain repeat protein n=1 Tax=Streptomyces sp. NPDC048639 TaxID=3365581 RepID=UPI00371B42F6